MKRILSIFSSTVACLCVLTVSAYAVDISVTDFSKTTEKNQTLAFTKANFESNYADADTPAEALDGIKVTTIPASSEGGLQVSGAAVAQDDVIVATDLDNLTFVPANNFVGETYFDWEPSNPAGAGKISTVTIMVKEPTPVTPPAITPLPYADLQNHWANYSAGMLGKLGLIVGEEMQDQFYFYPDKTMNRAEFVLFVNATMDIAPKAGDSPFKDKIPSWIIEPSNAAYEAGILSGVNENGQLNMKPFKNLTRMEAIKMIDNVIGVPDVMRNNGKAFTDEAKIPNWGKSAAQNLAAYGIIKGDSKGNLNPSANITRAEAAEMLYQAYKFVNSSQGTKAKSIQK